MRIVKWILGIVAVLAVVFVGGAFFLPQEVTVSRTASINAAPEAVFPHVNSLKATEKWSPWLGIDPEVKTTFSGPDQGVGAKLEWESDHPQVGSGSQEIVLSTANERVETALDFGEMGTAKAAFLLSGTGETTEITWNLVSDMGTNPVGRWMGLMMDNWVGADYEKGLSNLKALVEQGG
jgi:hypothetical protein